MTQASNPEWAVPETPDSNAPTPTPQEAAGAAVEEAAGGTITYTYDALDRIATRNGAAFTYAGKELDPVSDGEFAYSHSPSGDLLALDDTWNPDPSLLAGRDRHGDLTDLFTPAGALSDTMSYDPFGDPTGESGYTDPNVGFQADYTDPASEDVWMGARWYAPELDTFLSRDSIPEKLATPISLNRYTYAQDDPLDYYDADGHWGWRIPRWRAPAKARVNWAGLGAWVAGTVRRPAPRGHSWQGIVFNRAKRSPAPRTEPSKVKLPCSAVRLDCTPGDFKGMNRRQQTQYLRNFNTAYGAQYNMTADVKGLVRQTKKSDSKWQTLKNSYVLEGLQGGMYLTKHPGATSTPGRKTTAAGSQKFARYIDHQASLIGKAPSATDRKRSKELFGNAIDTARTAGENAIAQDVRSSFGGSGPSLGGFARSVGRDIDWVKDNTSHFSITASACVFGCVAVGLQGGNVTVAWGGGAIVSLGGVNVGYASKPSCSRQRVQVVGQAAYKVGLYGSEGWNDRRHETDQSDWEAGVSLGTTLGVAEMHGTTLGC